MCYRPSTIDDMKRRSPSVSTCSAEDLRSAPPVVGPLDGPEAEAELAALAKALSHPIRVKILRMLARKNAHMCSHIVDELPLAQSTVSEHLRILRAVGLVKANETGPRVAYCIVPSALKRFKALLNGV